MRLLMKNLKYYHMTKKNFLQLFAILIFLAFFAITFSGYFMEATEIVKSGAKVFGNAFEAIVEFFTLTK